MAIYGQARVKCYRIKIDLLKAAACAAGAAFFFFALLIRQ